MLLGHYGLAFAAKRAAPRASLGVLAFAAQWLDELWPILLLAGIERVSIVPGLMHANSLDFVFYPYSHSLLMALIWAAAIGAAYFVARRYGRGALVVAALVASHWFLDLPMHRPDLPLWPGSTTLLGFGLWNSIHVTLVVEFVIFIAGLAVYTRTTRPRDRIGSWGLYIMAALLIVFFVAGTFAPPPADERGLAMGALGLWLFVPWTYWIDRHRIGVTDAPLA